MDRTKYNILDYAKPEHLTAPVREMIRIEGQYLCTDDDGVDQDMEGKTEGKRFVIVDTNKRNGVGWGLIQYLYVVDGHVIAAVWFGGFIHHYSFTFNVDESLLLVPTSPTTNPCNQDIDEHYIVHNIPEYWIAEKQNDD